MATKMTLPDENIAQMRRFVTEMQQTGDTSKLDEIVHPDFCDHTAEGTVHVGVDGVRAIVKTFHAAFSDVKIDMIHCVGDGDVVATYKVVFGKHIGEFRDYVPSEQSSGQRTRFDVMDFVKFENGLFREHWATLGPLTVVKEE